MPHWFKNAVFLLIFLVALANFRAIGDGVSQLGSAIGGIFHSDLFHYRDPIYRFAMGGVILVVILALWTVFWKNQGGNNNSS